MENMSEDLELIFQLFNVQELATILGISPDEVKKRIHEPHVRFVVEQLIRDNVYSDENGRFISDSEYNPNCNGPPVHIFEIQDEDPYHIKVFKAKLTDIGTFLDIWNKDLLETTAYLGVKYLKTKGIYMKRIYSFVFACYDVAALILRVKLYRWNMVFNLFKELGKLNVDSFHNFRRELLNLARKLGFSIPEERLEIYEEKC